MKHRAFYMLVQVLVVFGAVAALMATLSVNATHPKTTSVTWTDDFSSTTLNERWSWIREVPAHWSLTDRPGFLRITTQQTFTEVNNLLVQNAPLGDYEIETRVLFTPTENFQFASLMAYQADDTVLLLGRAYCNVGPPACVGNGIYFDHVENGSPIGSNYAMTITVQDEAYLRMVRSGDVFSGYVSIDGANWILVGAHTVNFTPTEIGLRASNQIPGPGEIPADFDYFTLVDNSNMVYLPAVLK